MLKSLRMIHKDGIHQSPCRPWCRVTFCTLVMLSCGVRTRVREPLEGDMRVAQTFNPCHVLPRSFGVQKVY